jgi:hypothetical protein
MKTTSTCLIFLLFVTVFNVPYDVKQIVLSTGDPRRPYPTDFEMRLGKVDLPLNTPMLQSQGSYGEPMSSNRSSTQGVFCENRNHRLFIDNYSVFY